MKNPFEFNEKDKIIACVGDNGGTDDNDIRMGFKRTVEIMIDLLRDKNETEDILVYPIVYNARHSIELSLKIIIKLMWKIEETKGIQQSNEVIAQRRKSLHTHSIRELYKKVEENLNLDRRMSSYIVDLEELIKFYYFDADGDAFKYELDIENKHNMKKNNIQHVSIEVLGNEFDKIMNIFDKFIEFLEYCVFEYSLGTFTKKLNREDLLNISKILPNYKKWETTDFENTKAKIIDLYEISNSEFSRAINCIKNNRKFSANIGKEMQFGEIKEEELKTYALMIKNCSEDKQCLINSGIKIMLEESLKNENKLLSYKSKMSLKTLKILLSFYEIGSEYFLVSEKLDHIYERIEQEILDGDYIINKISKKISCLMIIKGMEKCGQITYIKQLETSLNDLCVNLYERR